MAKAAVMPEERIQWVTFEVEGETYGINVMQVQEVLRVTEIAPVPGAPDYVLGIINLRGNVVGVLDSRKRFGLPPREVGDQSRIVITEINHQQVGLLVDSVAEVVDVSRGEIDPSPDVGSDLSGQFIHGVVSRDNRLLILLDLARLLNEDEWREISAL